ncbi:hypothetical protein FPY71_03880 [Aureimonas fodinaquatilis]|uniref:RTX pore-forming domain-containing protein n=1 Tax=Aureimonas fodinaquatilis TaxID=2565783 RepID=A0A5B0E0B9_9HYPH|nr:hypothetical protein [Aureimonas fodinaquatilis]KAA0972253.1 hypothetical protein FPY71_03880 [Aureimonas fodinaquatilis]
MANDTELLAGAALAIADYNSINSEIKALDDVIARLFGVALNREETPGLTFDFADATYAVLSRVGDSARLVNTAGSTDAGAPDISLPSAGSESARFKPMDAVFEAAWTNTRLFNTRATIGAALEKARFQDLIALNGDFPDMVAGRYYRIENGEIVPAQSVFQARSLADDLVTRQSLTAIFSLIHAVNSTLTMHDTRSHYAQVFASWLRFASDLTFAYQSLGSYYISGGAEAAPSNATKALAAPVLSVAAALFGIAKIIDMQGSSGGALLKWRDGLQLGYFGSELFRGFRLLGEGLELTSPQFVTLSTAVSALGALSNIGAGIVQIVDSGVNGKGSASYLAMQGVDRALPILAGIGMVVWPSLVASGMMMTASMTSLTAIHEAIKLGKVQDEFLRLFAQSGWAGDKAMADHFGAMKTKSILSATPVINLFSAMFGMLDTSKRSADRILADYGVTDLSDSEAVSQAARKFMIDGLDARERAVQADYIAALKRIAASTETKRIIAVTGQELRADQAAVAALLGTAFVKEINSSRHYFYDLSDQTRKDNGLVATASASNSISIDSTADSQYFLFLTPIMPVTPEERAETISGKSVKNSLVPLQTLPGFELMDGAASTVADIRKFASFAPFGIAATVDDVNGVEGGLSVEMGQGNDVVIAGARAMFVNGGGDVDGVDYRHALTRADPRDLALQVKTVLAESGQATYRVRKSGYGIFHRIVEREATVQEGKYTKTVTYHAVETEYDAYSNNQIDHLVEVEWIHGTSFADRFDGAGASDIFFGGDGEDQLTGAGGDDQLFGGAHNDQLHGGEGFDLMVGDAGDDVLVDKGIMPGQPETGNKARKLGDTLIGGEGNDTIMSGAGDDLLLGDDASAEGYSASTAVEKPGVSYRDSLFGEAGNDTIDGGWGDDFIDAGDGHDQVFGGTGKDTLLGGIGNDTIWGGDGDDSIVGGGGEDALYGMDGNDTLVAGPLGSILVGGRGRDSLTGGIGHDILIGGDGSDTLRGGDGNDTISLRFVSYGVVISLENKSIVKIDPTKTGSNDPVTKDALRGLEWVEGTEFGDEIVGSGGENRLVGRGGNDIISGGAGKDILFGGDGADILISGAGSDIMDGGAGDDILHVESGDTLFFDGNFGTDTVLSADSLPNFSNTLLIFTGIDYRNLWFERSADNLLISHFKNEFGVDKSDIAGHAGVAVLNFFSENANTSKFAIADQNGSALVVGQIATLTAAMSVGAGVGTTGYDYSIYRPVQDAAWVLAAGAVN